MSFKTLIINAYGSEAHDTTRDYTSHIIKKTKAKTQLTFLNRCIHHQLIPRFLRIRCPVKTNSCLLYTSPSPRDRTRSRMPSSA